MGGPPIRALRFRSEDRRFALTVTANALTRIARSCREASMLETGGILLGRYGDAHDRAIVTAASSAPRDSRSGRTWFERGVEGLQPRLERAWRKHRTFYLGEWHYHPLGPPSPSPVDIVQMTAFAEAECHHCPEPVLLIVGGDPRTTLEARVHAFPRGETYVELLSELVVKAGELSRPVERGLSLATEQARFRKRLERVDPPTNRRR